MDSSPGCPGAIPFCHVSFLQNMAELDGAHANTNVEMPVSVTLVGDPGEQVGFTGPAGSWGSLLSFSLIMSLRLFLNHLGSWLAAMGHLHTLEVAEVRLSLPATCLPVSVLSCPLLLMASAHVFSCTPSSNQAPQQKLLSPSWHPYTCLLHTA